MFISYFYRMKNLLTVLIFLAASAVFSQNADSLILRKIFENAINSKDAYNNLEYLCNETPGRLMGSESSIKALNYLKSYFEKLDVDTVYLQAYKTDSWRCNSSSVIIKSPEGDIELSAVVLGPSAKTYGDGITANVIEVQSIEELNKMERSEIKGKVVFFNRPVKNTFTDTFQMYSEAVDQRARGPEAAMEKGAVAAIVRSVTSLSDDVPHSGSTHFDKDRIPALALGVKSADKLSEMLKNDIFLNLNIKVDAEILTNITTYNLIAEIKGHEKPKEVILVGGHIDSWLNTAGAHDDGAGIVQTGDVLRIFKELQIQNKRTIRFVAFMDEEYTQSGGKYYAESIDTLVERPYFALEADAGAFTPTGFTFTSTEAQLELFKTFKPLLEPYGIKFIQAGWGGVDIYPLKKFNIPLTAFRTDTHRYFDLHHSANDTFDKINFRELQMGTTCISGLIFLTDKYGDW